MGDTGIYKTRIIGGKKYTRYHVENYKSEANMMADRYKKKGMKTKVMKYKDKWAVMVA